MTIQPAQTPESPSPALGKVNTACFYTFNFQDALSHLRMIAPAHHLGLEVIHGVEDGQVHPERASQGEVIVLQRDFPRAIEDYEAITQLARQHHIPVILDIDDLLFELPDDHPDRLSHTFTWTLLPTFRALVEADLVTVSTQPLADVVRGYNPNVFVLPNFLDDHTWKLIPPARKAENYGKLIIGYMGGLTHLPDLEMLVPLVPRLIDRYPGRLEFHFWGAKPPAELAALPETHWYGEVHWRYTDFAAYFQSQQADIFIAPLVDNQFNRCKSGIKYLEYASLGVPGVFSQVAPYEAAITHGVNGMLAATLTEWESCLMQLIEDQELRYSLTTRAQEDIQAKWLLSRNAHLWQTAFQHARSSMSSPKPAEPAYLDLISSFGHQTVDWHHDTQHQLKTQEARIEALSKQTAQLEVSVAQLEHSVAQKIAVIDGITNSRTWKTALALRSVRESIIPHGSRRERLLARRLGITADKDEIQIGRSESRMLNLAKKIRDFFFPPFSKQRDGYEYFRKAWLTLKKKGVKVVYQEISWRTSRPRRISVPTTVGDTAWNKGNPLFDAEEFANIQPLPLSEKVDLIICVGPNHENILPCLSSIEQFTDPALYDLHLVVHRDDAANLPTHPLIFRAHRVMHDMRLFNYSRANNLVLKDSSRDVVLLNDDTEVTEGWLEKLRQDSKGVALTGAHTGHMRAGNPQMWEQGPARLTNYPINMFCAYIPSRVREVVGLLDEEFCYYGGEDVDYSCRTLLNGFPLVISSAYVEHKDNQSFRTTKDVLIKESDRLLVEMYGIEAPFDLSAIKPRVSVILATHNRPELLKAAIESVLSIQYDNFEFIVVDDFSNKATSEVISHYQQVDDRVIAIRLPRNVGSSRARTLGLNASRGQFVLFTDDDDTVLPNRISKPLEYLVHHPWLDVVYCNYNLVSDDGSVTPVLNKLFDLDEYLEMEYYIGFGVLLGRKKTFLDVPFMSIYDKAVDFDWVFRLLRKGHCIDLCPEIVMNYNRTGAPKFHLSGNPGSIDLHETIKNRELLLQSMERRSPSDRLSSHPNQSTGGNDHDALPR